MSDAILDKLTKYLKKNYISDLKQLTSEDKAISLRLLKRSNVSDYTPDSWTVAYRYITGYRETASAEEARAKLIAWLEQNKE